MSRKPSQKRTAKCKLNVKPQTQQKRDKWFELLEHFCNHPYSADPNTNDLLNERANQGPIDIVHEVMFNEQFAVILLSEFHKVVYKGMTIKHCRSPNFRYKDMMTHSKKEDFMMQSTYDSNMSTMNAEVNHKVLDTVNGWRRDNMRDVIMGKVTAPWWVDNPPQIDITQDTWCQVLAVKEMMMARCHEMRGPKKHTAKDPLSTMTYAYVVENIAKKALANVDGYDPVTGTVGPDGLNKLQIIPDRLYMLVIILWSNEINIDRGGLSFANHKLSELEWHRDYVVINCGGKNNGPETKEDKSQRVYRRTDGTIGLYEGLRLLVEGRPYMEPDHKLFDKLWLRIARMARLDDVDKSRVVFSTKSPMGKNYFDVVWRNGYFVVTGHETKSTLYSAKTTNATFLHIDCGIPLKKVGKVFTKHSTGIVKRYIQEELSERDRVKDKKMAAEKMKELAAEYERQHGILKKDPNLGHDSKFKLQSDVMAFPTFLPSALPPKLPIANPSNIPLQSPFPAQGFQGAVYQQTVPSPFAPPIQDTSTNTSMLLADVMGNDIDMSRIKKKKKVPGAFEKMWSGPRSRPTTDARYQASGQLEYRQFGNTDLLFFCVYLFGYLYGRGRELVQALCVNKYEFYGELHPLRPFLRYFN